MDALRDQRSRMSDESYIGKRRDIWGNTDYGRAWNREEYDQETTHERSAGEISRDTKSKTFKKNTGDYSVRSE